MSGGPRHVKVEAQLTVERFLRQRGRAPQQLTLTLTQADGRGGAEAAPGHLTL